MAYQGARSPSDAATVSPLFRIRVAATALAMSCSAAFAVTACGGDDEAGPVTLSLWSHGGTDQERAALTVSVLAYEADHPDTDVEITVIPEGEYPDRVQAAIAAGTLPDVLDIDGPLVASYAEQQALLDLTDRLPAGTIEGLLPSLREQGTWSGRLWAVGAFESGLGIWGDRAALTAAGVRVPTGPQEAWTASEFTAALAALASADDDGKVLDLRRDYGVGEWLTYGFGPLVHSAGGSLEDLGSPQAQRALETLGSWARYVEDNEDGAALTERRVALSWVGHWVYPDYAEALGADLVLLPLPDVGTGSLSGQGSWAWGVSAGTAAPQAATDLVAHLTSDATIEKMTEANGAVPGSRTSLAASAEHAAGGPLHLYSQQLLEGYTVARPVRPDYPRITAAYAEAVDAVLNGGEAAAALAEAQRALE